MRITSQDKTVDRTFRTPRDTRISLTYLIHIGGHHDRIPATAEGLTSLPAGVLEKDLLVTAALRCLSEAVHRISQFEL